MSPGPPMISTLHEQVGLAFNEVHRTMFDHPFEGRVELFEAVGREFIPQLEAAGCHREALEVRRRVAEGILHAASLTRRPVAECEALLARVEALGYTDLLTRWHVLLPLVAYYRRRRSVRRALGHLDPLIADLEEAEVRTGEPVWTKILAAARELRAGIVQRGKERRGKEQRGKERHDKEQRGKKRAR